MYILYIVYCINIVYSILYKYTNLFIDLLLDFTVMENILYYYYLHCKIIDFIDTLLNLNLIDL